MGREKEIQSEISCVIIAITLLAAILTSLCEIILVISFNPIATILSLSQRQYPEARRSCFMFLILISFPNIPRLICMTLVFWWHLELASKISFPPKQFLFKYFVFAQLVVFFFLETEIRLDKRWEEWLFAGGFYVSKLIINFYGAITTALCVNKDICKKKMSPPGIEPGTLCVWGTRDNRYTTETWKYMKSKEMFLLFIFHIQQ